MGCPAGTSRNNNNTWIFTQPYVYYVKQAAF